MDSMVVYVVFGGRSGEHESSVTSAQAVVEHLDRDRYEVVAVGITRSGRWLVVEDIADVVRAGGEVVDGTPATEAGDSVLRALVPPGGGPREMSGTERAGSRSVPSLVFFPVLPGTYGEDGTLQGAFEMAGVPYVGAGVLASALAMDKAAAKAMLQHAGLPVVPYSLVLRSAWERDSASIVAAVEEEFGYPVFVKPANSGSSLGTSRVVDGKELTAALDEAAWWDRRLLVEIAIDAREIEVAVLGNENPVASVPGEVVPGAEFYDFRDKHIDDRAREVIPAPLTTDQAEAVQALSLSAFRALDCCGMARVDLLLDRDSGRLRISEVNTLPAFRRKSMFPRLFEAMGYTYSEILDRLIELALSRWQDRQRNRVRPPEDA